MKVTAECIPCYLNQILNAMEKGEFPPAKRAETLAGLLSKWLLWTGKRPLLKTPR